MFEGLSKTAQAELEMQKGRRVTHFQKSLHELAELEVCLWLLACQHSSSSLNMMTFLFAGEACQGPCSNAEADNKCHQDRSVRSVFGTERLLRSNFRPLLALHLQSWPRFCWLTNISSYPLFSNLIVDRLWRTIMVHHHVPVSISIANLVIRDYEVIWSEDVM